MATPTARLLTVRPTRSELVSALLESGATLGETVAARTPLTFQALTSWALCVRARLAPRRAPAFLTLYPHLSVRRTAGY